MSYYLIRIDKPA